MPAKSAAPLNALAAELGAVAGRIEREAALRIDAALADLRRVDAERELRLTNLERAVADRLALVKDGEPGADADPALIERLVSARVDRAVASIPAPKDGTSVTIEDVRPVLAEMVAAIPPAAPGKDADPQVTRRLVADLVAEAVAALPTPADGKSVDPGDVQTMVNAAVAKAMSQIPSPRDGLDADPDVTAALVKAEVSKAVAAIPAPANGKDADPLVIERMVGEAVAKTPPAAPGKSITVDDVRPMLQEMIAELPAPADGKSVTLDDVRPLIDEAVAKLPPAQPGPPGKLPVVKAWADRVHYEGEVASHRGSTYQAQRDTGREPPHEDWICIAKAGRDGNDGRSPKVRGTFSADARDYLELDVVALNGAAFIARRDNPGACPGDGWQLIAAQGKRGHPGERSTIKGPPGPAVVRMSVDDQGLLTIANADGSTVECDLYPLLSRLSRA